MCFGFGVGRVVPAAVVVAQARGLPLAVCWKKRGGETIQEAYGILLDGPLYPLQKILDQWSNSIALASKCHLFGDECVSVVHTFTIPFQR